jgi:hypothetical protein
VSAWKNGRILHVGLKEFQFKFFGNEIEKLKFDFCEV